MANSGWRRSGTLILREISGKKWEKGKGGFLVTIHLVGKQGRLTRFCTQSNWTKTLPRFAYFCSCIDNDVLVDLDLLIVLGQEKCKRKILGSIDVVQSSISSNIVNTLDKSQYHQERKLKMHQGPYRNYIQGYSAINTTQASKVRVKVAPVEIERFSQ